MRAYFLQGGTETHCDRETTHAPMIIPLLICCSFGAWSEAKPITTSLVSVTTQSPPRHPPRPPTEQQCLAVALRPISPHCREQEERNESRDREEGEERGEGRGGERGGATHLSPVPPSRTDGDRGASRRRSASPTRTPGPPTHPLPTPQRPVRSERPCSPQSLKGKKRQLRDTKVSPAGYCLRKW